MVDLWYPLWERWPDHNHGHAWWCNIISSAAAQAGLEVHIAIPWVHPCRLTLVQPRSLVKDVDEAETSTFRVNHWIIFQGSVMIRIYTYIIYYYLYIYIYDYRCDGQWMLSAASLPCFRPWDSHKWGAETRCPWEQSSTSPGSQPFPEAQTSWRGEDTAVSIAGLHIWLVYG